MMSRFTTRFAVGLGLVALLGLGAYWLVVPDETPALETSVSLADAMSGDTTGYRRATTVRPFTFPRDHGPHPGYKTEWWYVTGTLQGPDAAPYGYELTIFRLALTPPSAVDSTASSWRTNQLYMAHFALTDGAAKTFRAFERFQRGGAGLAGAQADPFRVWLDNWSMASTGASTFPIRLQAHEQGAGIDLTLRPTKPRVLQGNQGLSRGGPNPGDASYYYSYTRLDTEGTIVVGGDTVAVSGDSWLDREWGTSALGPEIVGWDWFALRLDDGRDLMYYRLRRENGTASPFSKGTLVGPDGTARKLDPDDVQTEVLRTWTSPDGARTYPVEWAVRVPDAGLDLRITPYLPNQELDVSVRYWEGAVRVEGSVSGQGYVELTGYGDSAPAPAL